MQVHVFQVFTKKPPFSMNDFSVPLKNLENAIVGHEEEDLTCPSRLLDLVLALFRLHSFSVFATGLCHFLGVKQKRKKGSIGQLGILSYKVIPKK